MQIFSCLQLRCLWKIMLKRCDKIMETFCTKYYEREIRIRGMCVYFISVPLRNIKSEVPVKWPKSNINTRSKVTFRCRAKCHRFRVILRGNSNVSRELTNGSRLKTSFPACTRGRKVTHKAHVRPPWHFKFAWALGCHWFHDSVASYSLTY